MAKVSKLQRSKSQLGSQSTFKEQLLMLKIRIKFKYCKSDYNVK